MSKTILVRLLSHTKKYIVQTVLFPLLVNLDVGKAHWPQS